MLQEERTTPRRGRGAWIVGGVVVIVVAVAVAVLTVWFVRDRTLGASQEDQQQTYPHPVSAVTLDLDGGDVTVGAGADDQVAVHRHLSWRGTRPTVTEQWEGDILHITARCPGSGDCSTDYGLTVPAPAAVTVNDRGGAITTTGVRGAQQLHTGGGDVDVTGAGSTVDAHTDGGAVRGSALATTKVTAESLGGDVTLDCAVPPTELSAQTQGGAVTVLVPRTGSGPAGYEVHATGVGDQQSVQVPNDPQGQHQLIAGSAGGALTVRYR
jgi:hypothetical protein